MLITKLWSLFIEQPSYYARFCEGYAYLIHSLKHGDKWRWNNEWNSAIKERQKAILDAVIFKYPHFNEKWYLQNDTSGLGIFQRRENVIAYARRTLKGPEKSYSTTENETLPNEWAVPLCSRILLQLFLLLSCIIITISRTHFKVITRIASIFLWYFMLSG